MPPKKARKSAAGDAYKSASKSDVKKKKKGRKGRKKKEPRCPIKRRKKAIKRSCTDVLNANAILNTYYVCHGVQDMLKFRKFTWKKKKK